MNIITVKNPRWATPDQTAILMVIETDEYPGEELPFSTSAADSEPHGRDIYERVLRGEFGEIAPYAAPTLTPEELLAESKREALAYLYSTDWYVVRMMETGTPVPQDILDRRSECRAIL